MPPSSYPTSVSSWLQRGAWSLADQWFFSGANFIANILLARWLLPAEYGAFALVFSIYLFSLTVHDALLSEPMLVLGNSKFENSAKQYVGLLFKGHLLLSLAAGFLMYLFTWVAPTNELVRGGLHAAGLLMPALLLPWLLRRVVLLNARADWAFLFSFIYSVFLLVGTWLIQQQGALSVSLVFAVFGLASLAASLPFVHYYRKSITRSTETLLAKEVLQIQWGYAKWALAATLPIWVPLNLFYFVLPVYGGLEAAGDFKAFSNLIMPFTQSSLAISLLLLPQLSNLAEQGSKRRLLDQVRKYLLVIFAAALLYWLCLYLLRLEILTLLYDGRYPQLGALLAFAGVLLVAMGISRILVTGLRALQQPRQVFEGYAVGALLAASFGVWLTLEHAVVGALVGQTLAYLGMCTLLAWQLFKGK
ncbi:MAG: hypothetical protein KIS85_05740 [Anaerolineales bacterium]|nr:hypothetical protein [Anaerolineales bacterium]